MFTAREAVIKQVGPIPESNSIFLLYTTGLIIWIHILTFSSPYCPSTPDIADSYTYLNLHEDHPDNLIDNDLLDDTTSLLSTNQAFDFV